MKKNLFLTAIFVFSLCSLIAQNKVSDYINKGVECHDAGKYQQALNEYAKALALDAKSATANYEMAYTYLEMKEYAKAVDFADKAIKCKGNNVEAAYMIKGSALDDMGKSNDAIKSYEKGLAENPKSSLLNYNLGLTYYRAGDKKKAETALIKGIDLKLTHPSGHLLLAIIKSETANRTQSLLASYFFLLLEPNSKRSQDALALIQKEYNQGIKFKDDKNIEVNIQADGLKKDDPFSASDLMVSLLALSKTLDENKGKTDEELFVKNTESLFTMLGEMQENQKLKGFWWDTYVTFFSEMAKEKQVEAFCYYILSENNEAAGKWVKEHEDKIEAFAAWLQK